MSTFARTPTAELGAGGFLLFEQPREVLENALALVTSLVNGLFRAVNQLADPNSRLSKDVGRWRTEVLNETGATGRRFYDVLLRPRRTGDVDCFPALRFALLRTSQDVAIEPYLVFVRGNGVGRRELKIVIEWGGATAPERKTLSENLGNSGLRTIYIPDRLSKGNSQWQWPDTVRFLLLLYLVQHEIISLDHDEPAQEFLFGYLGKFRDARKIGVKFLLAQLIRSYRFATDYRSLGPYIAKVARGLVAAETNKALTSYVIPEESQSGVKNRVMFERAAATLGISVRTLYAGVTKRKVNAKLTSAADGRAYLTVDEEEIDRLKNVLERNTRRKELIEQYGLLRNISKNSARRWIELQERKGLSLEDLRQRVIAVKKSRP